MKPVLFITVLMGYSIIVVFGSIIPKLQNDLDQKDKKTGQEFAELSQFYDRCLSMSGLLILGKSLVGTGFDDTDRYNSFLDVECHDAKSNGAIIDRSETLRVYSERIK